MRKFDWVFLDLETTGLNPVQDKIIEVAAVTLSAKGKQEVFHQLVNPGIPVPEYITRLTGIDSGMVNDAPAFTEISASLLQFLEGRVIVAHNAGFDISFLQAALGRPLTNSCLDTYDFAKLLFPNYSSYSLRYLVRALELPVKPAHRALDDALALESLFIRLLEMVNKLPLYVLREIAYFLQGSGNGLSELLDETLRKRIKNYDFKEGLPAKRREGTDGAVGAEDSPALKWDIGMLEKMFLPGGAVARGLDTYQKRDQQMKMLKAVGKAFTQERHLLVEAGTGVGKSLAYLVPSLAWACSQGEKVVVSTYTIALQEQLLHSEIEFLKKSAGFKFKAAVLKGRANYICLQKWKTLKDNAAGLSWPEKLLMARIGLWLSNENSGDRDSINLRDWETEFYSHMASSGEICPGSQCPYVGECFYQKAKQAAQQADLVIVNHALLLSDLKLGETILPKYGYLVVDEAHHLEEEGTRQFSEIFSLREFKKRIVRLQGRRDTVKKQSFMAFIKQVIPFIRNINPELAGEVAALIKGVQEALADINVSLDEIEQYFLEKQPPEIIRIHDGAENRKWWQHLSLFFDNLKFKTLSLLEGLDSLYKRMTLVPVDQEGEGPLREQRLIVEQLNADCELVKRFFQECRDPDRVYWLEKDPLKNDLRLYITPLKTDRLFHDLLFSVKNSVVLTSATLSVEEDFSFLEEQLGIPPELADTLCIPSPFLYEEQALLLVDNSLPDPARTSEEGYNLAVAEALLSILHVAGGNSLVLFTSHKQLRYIYEQLAEPMRRAGLELFADGVNGQRSSLISELKNNSRAVVLGANAFWEGIDLPGQSLTTLVIVRLPFYPPSLPLVEARMEELKKTGKNGFYHYSLPQAVLKFRQGYGRLIRTMNDCGVVVVLDNRLVNKSYGKTFINSLPNFRYYAGDTAAVTERIEQWFDELEIKK